MGEWIDLVVLPMQMYLAQQRAPVPADATLQAQLDEKREAFVAYLTNYGGLTSARFSIPTPLHGQPKA